MKLSIAVTCITFLLALSACNTRSGNGVEYERSSATTSPAGAGGGAPQEASGVNVKEPVSERTANAARSGESDLMETKSGILPASLTQTDGSQPSGQAAVERKIIRDAEINIEVASPAEGQRKLGAIAEAHGGFVVTSESRLQGDGAGSGQAEIVTVRMRVPATRFDAVVAEIRAVGSRVRAEKITGKDVTEEFIDLDARLRTQRALEAQFLEIMKRAGKVSDALEVHSQLAEVRTEIERVEGRRRFLENQAALSTINATLQPPAPLVGANTTGFFQGVRRAFGDGLDIAAEIILGIISFSIALLPVLLFIVLPLALVWRYLLRPRLRRRRKLPAPPASAMP
ncbi:MAG: DUF4349 domain-containing protein [Acidobacteria bacterium]|nr:DUF4349 domain-containing protein [Acidobacteriota bacterium]